MNTQNSDWIEGHYSGSLTHLHKNDRYQVRFTNEKSKSFKTEKEAILYKNKYSDEKGLTKNKYRYVDDYIEVQLYGDHIAKVSIEDLHLVKDFVWSKNGNNMVRNKNTSTKSGFFHRLIYPEWPVVEHINKDTIDNRRTNLRNKSKKQVNITNNITNNITSQKSKWIGGHHGGSLNYIPKDNRYIVRFPTEKTQRFKTEEEAILYRNKRSEEKGWTKNKYRYVDNYIEIQLQDEHIAKVSVEDFHLFKDCVWSATPGHNRFYMTHSGKKLKGLPSQRFHRLIHPEWSEIDHINRDGLDNRRSNLRNGSNSVNVTNQSKRKDNKSGKTGVSFDKNRWVVQWPENGKRNKKSFSVNKYGLEVSKEKATQFRLELDKRLKLDNGYSSDCEDEDKDKEYPAKNVINIAIDIPKKLLITNTSGVEGVRFTGKAWIAYWTINKKRGNKTYSLLNYGDKAKELAIQKRLEMNPNKK